MSFDVGEERKGWRMGCDVGENWICVSNPGYDTIFSLKNYHLCPLI